jgi:hypothetical protein
VADVCISTVADRHALHSIYNNTVKKTVFDLTKRVYAMRKASLDAHDVARRRCVVARDARALRRQPHFSNSAKTSISQGLLAIQIARGEFRQQKILRARVTAFALASRRTAISARLK